MNLFPFSARVRPTVGSTHRAKLIALAWLLLATFCTAETAALLTEQEAQRIFDNAVAAADHASVTHEWGGWVPLRSELLRRLPVAEFSSVEKIRLLSEQIRIHLPPPSKKIVNGQEVVTLTGFLVGSSDWFHVVLQKNGSEIFAFAILGENTISCDAIRGDSAIHVEAVALAPLRAELRRLLADASARVPLRPSISTDYPAAAVSRADLEKQFRTDAEIGVVQRMGWDLDLATVEGREQRAACARFADECLDASPSLVADAQKSECPSDTELDRAFTELDGLTDIRQLPLFSFYVALWTNKRLNLPQRILFERIMLGSISVARERQANRTKAKSSP